MQVDWWKNTIKSQVGPILPRYSSRQETKEPGYSRRDCGVSKGVAAFLQHPFFFSSLKDILHSFTYCR